MAVLDGIIQSSPAALAQQPPAPRTVRDPHRNLSADDARTIMRRLMSTPPDGLHAAVILALSCGLRRGEILALRWSDIEGGRITVDKSLDRHRRLSTTKTVGSDRTAFAPPSITTWLDRWRLAQQSLIDCWTPDTCVCTNHANRPWSPANLNRSLRTFFCNLGLGTWTSTTSFTAQRKRRDGTRQHYRCTRKSGYVGPCLHSLRHAFATSLVASGTDIKTAQTLLGHARASTTLDMYAHAVEDNLVAATAGHVERLLRPFPTSAAYPFYQRDSGGIHHCSIKRTPTAHSAHPDH